MIIITFNDCDSVGRAASLCTCSSALRLLRTSASRGSGRIDKTALFTTAARREATRGFFPAVRYRAIGGAVGVTKHVIPPGSARRAGGRGNDHLPNRTTDVVHVPLTAFTGGGDGFFKIDFFFTPFQHLQAESLCLRESDW